MSDRTCLSDELMEKTMSRALDSIAPKYAGQDKILFLTIAETMEMLRITSPTTMQKIRNEGKLPFFKVSSKLIIYKKSDVLEYMETTKQSKF